MNKDKLLSLFSKMSFTWLVLVWLLTVTWILVPVWNEVSRSIALDSPTQEIGKKNSILIIDTIEAYNADHRFYPQNLHDTIIYNPDVLDHLHDYAYEVYTANSGAREFMLSFRVRWTIDNWYCYSSEDQKWLQSGPTCWSDPRLINEVVK